MGVCKGPCDLRRGSNEQRGLLMNEDRLALFEERGRIGRGGGRERCESGCLAGGRVRSRRGGLKSRWHGAHPRRVYSITAVRKSGAVVEQKATLLGQKETWKTIYRKLP